MNKYFLALTISFLTFFVASTKVFAFVDEVSSFHSDITINQDTSISIIEQIDYTTDLQKHGIYRYIPIAYNHEGIKEVLPVRDLVVTDDAGQEEPYSSSSDGKFLTIKIGDPDATFTGDKTYLISYRIERAIRKFSDHSELYWDITGEGWQIPVVESSASITSNFAPIEKIDCFAGEVGTSNRLCKTDFNENSANFIYNQPIEYGDNFTIVVGLPLDSELIFPTQSEIRALWLRDNWTLFLIPFPLLLMILWWRMKGRDIQFISPNVFDMSPDQPTKYKQLSFRAREPFVYEPLKDLSPGEAGALLDEKVDTEDIVAEILELARKKYIKISSIEKKNFFGKKKDYDFKKLSQTSDGLSGAQLHLFNGLFALGDTTTVSRLKGSFYTTIQTAKQEMHNSLVARGIYTRKPNSDRALGFLVFLGSSGLTLFLLMNTVGNLGIYWPIPLLLLQLPFGLIIAYNMPQKSAIGSNLWLQARGLRKTIQYGKWREEVKEKNLFIEEVLPFAVALGVVSKLSKDMESLQMQPPDYLQGASIVGMSNSNWLGDFSKSIGSDLSYNPSSSSSSGGSGFSGGSSGGGGGGGGGGSW